MNSVYSAGTPYQRGNVTLRMENKLESFNSNVNRTIKRGMSC